MDRLARGAVRFRLLLLGTIADAKVSRNQRVTLVSLLNIPFVFAFIPPRQIGEELKTTYKNSGLLRQGLG